MTERVRVAGVQMPVDSRVDRNADAICAAIETAAKAGAEILLTPEGSLSGYRHDFDVAAVEAALERVTALARRRGVGLALGTCHREPDGKCYNQIRFYRPTGEYLGFHSKTLLCGTPLPEPVGEINHYAVAGLRVFEWRPGLAVGGLICNDLWANPQYTPMPDTHLTQRLAELGARIVFHAVNGGRDGGERSKVNWAFHRSNLQLRAAAGRIWIVTVDNADPPAFPCSSPSGVVDPQGRWVCETDPVGPQFFVHTIDLPPDPRPSEVRVAGRASFRWLLELI